MENGLKEALLRTNESKEAGLWKIFPVVIKRKTVGM
jgi:hypothetical protein